jgi:uncharacterized protein YfaP (DUF2135 family)
MAQPGTGPVNLTIKITWTHAADLDLHVHEPSYQGRAQHCYYGKRRTENGGTLDHDARRGPDHEQYTIRGGPEGRYQVEVHIYDDNGVPRPLTFHMQVWENGRLTVDSDFTTINTATYYYVLPAR